MARPELHQTAFLCLPRGGRVSDMMILVHERVQILEVLNAVTCIKVGLDSWACMQKTVALSGRIEQIEGRFSFVTAVCSQSAKG
jgi:uncharacterized membrane protein YpjA